MHIEIHSDQYWPDTAAEMWVSYMRTHPTARICLPTGDTPRPLYARSAQAIDLSSTTIFLLDEFDLPRGSAARCDFMLDRDLLELLHQPPNLLHRFHAGAPDAAAECARYDKLVSKGGLDLTLLGLGGNGHLGLNEPGTVTDSPTRVVDLTPETTNAAAKYEADARPTRGMTLGMRRIMESHEVWLLVTGLHKAAALEEMLSGPIGPEFPASYLRTHPNATIIADESAASKL